MIFKNGFKEYALSGGIFGLFMGIYFGIIYRSVIIGVITGTLCGVLFGLFIFLFCRHQEKKFDIKRNEISKERTIFCDGGATLNGVGGWLFFTTQGLEFYPHKINFSQKEIFIPLHSIKVKGSSLNNIVIQNGDDDVYIFRVSHRKEWKEEIEVRIGYER